MILKKAPLPADIIALGVDGINQIWREAKLRGSGLKRAKTLISAAEHSIGSREAQEAARIEVAYLLDDIERYTKRVKDLIELLDQKLAEIPHVDKLLAVPGLESVLCVDSLLKWAILGVLTAPNNCRNWLDYPLWNRVPASTKGRRTSATEVGNGSDMCYTKQHCRL